MHLAGALAIQRDDSLVIIECAFRAEPADDAKRLHLVTTNEHECCEMKTRSALQFVLIIGIVNFFADFTYEGARGIVGPFLGSLRASAAIIGFFAGLGELAGYALRSVTGYFADKTRQYWLMAFVGYTVNMLAVP